jgi:hypothetical protein
MKIEYKHFIRKKIKTAAICFVRAYHLNAVVVPHKASVFTYYFSVTVPKACNGAHVNMTFFTSVKCEFICVWNRIETMLKLFSSGLPTLPASGFH